MRNFNKTVHLEESELDNCFDKCPNCSSKKYKKIGIVQETPLVNALVCKNCHIGYADRQPTLEALDEYYANYYGTINRNTTIKKELLINHLSKHVINSEVHEEYNLLDFGGGDGSISHGLAEHILKFNKISIYVIDPNFVKFNNFNKNITIHNLPSIESIPNSEKVDFVIASAILEHVKDPRKIILQLFDVMKPSAKFYARTPYIFPFKSLFNSFGIDLTMDYPGHLFDMGNKFWNSTLSTLNKENDFQILISRTSLVETNIKENFFDWLISHAFKLPSKILKNHYNFVGGWEVFIKKNSE
jgi:SAM-dependent methyltransferase